MKKTAGKTISGRAKLISPEFFGVLQGIKISDFPPPAKPMEIVAPASATGSQVKAKAAKAAKAPQFDIGTLLSVAGTKILIEFPENTSKSFMAEFLALM